MRTLMAAVAALQILVPRAHVQHGNAIVPVYCDPAAYCDGEVTYPGAKPVKVRVAGDHGRVLRLPVGRGTRRLRLTIALRGVRPRRFVVTVSRTRVPATCGFAPLARVIATEGEKTLFEYEHAYELQTLMACVHGVSRYVVGEFDEGGYADGLIQATSLSPFWAAALYHTSDHYADAENQVCLTRLQDGKRFGWQYDSYAGGSFAPFADAKGLAVARHGALIVGQDLGGPQIRVVDDSGDRIVDDDPGVDPASVNVKGDVATWLRGATEQQAAVGRFSHLVATDPSGEADRATCH